jgi:hypothetical protein
MSPKEKQRYDKAQFIVGMGFDYRLAMIALEKNGDDPNVAAEWLFMGGGAVEEAQRSIAGTKVTFTTPEPSYHSSTFNLKFDFGGDGKPYEKGEWVGLYQVGQDDRDVDRMLIKISPKQRAAGIVRWPRQLAPSEPGQYVDERRGEREREREMERCMERSIKRHGEMLRDYTDC